MKYLQEVWGSRELLLNLTSREVRGKYKRTIFGQLWSLANPLALMLIYSLVFGVLFKSNPLPGDPSGLDVFALWLLCGLLPWTFFSAVVSTAASSLVGNANLIQKVSFSRIVLPLSTVGSSAYNWGFEMVVLLVAVSIAGGFVLPWIPLLIVAMILLAIFAAGVGLIFSIANVYFRDTQYLLGIVLQLWIYLTPIIYPIQLVEAASHTHGGLLGTPVTILGLYDLNPMVHFVALFRELIYDNRWPDGVEWLICLCWALGALVIGMIVFRKNEPNLAEAL
ncbi:ABC transporter permease [Lacisediminihabitans sp.]|jgi:ABC-2 type transport system permease protein|uniref:ABC transporter permease n=1 Tax=Lacisediminihabitans sp. TaxID=2787631 RepID=UPI002F9497C4